MIELDDIINNNLTDLLIDLKNDCMNALNEFESKFTDSEEFDSINKLELLKKTSKNWLPKSEETNSNNNNDNNENNTNNHNDENDDESFVLTQNEDKSAPQYSSTQRPGPNEAKLKEILDRTGYSHEVSSGQRKYGGPPPDLSKKSDDVESVGNVNITAPIGCECFIGKLPRDIFEDELIPLFEKQGRIWDLRLMVDPNSGFNKGYAFVTYCEKESAKLAAKNVSLFDIIQFYS